MTPPVRTPTTAPPDLGFVLNRENPIGRNLTHVVEAGRLQPLLNLQAGRLGVGTSGVFELV